MGEDDREKWNARYAAGEHGVGAPAAVLVDNMHLLPAQGSALDLACGLGANAIKLAETGLDVSAWDSSDVALDQLRREAGERGLRISLQQRDVIARPPEPESFDVIIVAHFLARNLIPQIVLALRKNGIVLYQTYTRDKPDGIGPRNSDYLLKSNELLQLFRGLTVLYYREDGRAGNPSRGARGLAMIAAQKS
jgi:SAM-dependent methyltransferase